MIEVFHKTDAHHTCASDSNIGISRKIAVDLQSKKDGGNNYRKRRCAIGIIVNGIDRTGKQIGNTDLLKEAEEHKFSTERGVFASKFVRLAKLRNKICGTLYRSCHKLREKGYEKRVEKEIRLGLAIDVHDFETKGNQAKKFISSGDKVKVSIRFRGRELGHPEIGLDVMKRFADYCSEVAVVEKPAKMEGRNMLMFLAPTPVK